MANKQKISIDWKNVIKLAVILFVITAIASLCLAMTNYVTSDVIDQRNEQANTRQDRLFCRMPINLRP